MKFNAVRRLFRSQPTMLITAAFVIYNINLRSVSSLDTYPTRFLPVSIIREMNLNLDEFPFLHEYPKWWEPDSKQEFPYYLSYTRGHYMSVYPVMPAILSVPVYILPVLLGLTDGQGSVISYNRRYDQTEIVTTLLSKISASIAVAFSVGIIYLALLHLTTRAAAFWIALIYAFATSSWSVSSQGLWQSAMSQPLLALSLYLFIRGRKNAHCVVYASIPLALAVACRSTILIFAAILFIYVIHKHRALTLRFAIFPIGIGVWLLTYNLYYFGSVMGGYSEMSQFRQGFGYPQWKALLGLLVSPSRGILVYSPVLLFAFVGLGSTLYHRCDIFLVYVVVATVLMSVFYSTVAYWDARFSFSYRYLVDLLPGLCLLLSTIWETIFKFRWSKGLFLASAIFSVLIQIIGSFFYPCGWYDTPVKASVHQERLWDWKDPEFLRCLRGGPVTPDGMQLMLKAISKK